MIRDAEARWHTPPWPVQVQLTGIVFHPFRVFRVFRFLSRCHNDNLSRRSNRWWTHSTSRRGHFAQDDRVGHTAELQHADTPLLLFMILALRWRTPMQSSQSYRPLQGGTPGTTRDAPEITSEEAVSGYP